MAKIKTTGIFTIVIIVISVFIIFGYITIQKKEKSVIQEAVDAIPINANYIIEIDNFVGLNQKLEKESEIFNNLLSFSQLTEFKSQLIELDSIVENSEFLSKFLKNRSFLVSSHLVGSNKIDFLIATKLKNNKEASDLLEEFQLLSKDTINLLEKYNETNIYVIIAGQKDYFFAFIDNLFIFSKSKQLIENSIRQKISNNSISLDLGFKETSETLTKNKLHFYFNYENFSQVSTAYFSSKFSNKIKNLYDFANWACMDIKYNYNSISFSGFSYCENSPDKYLQMFNNSEPQKFDISNILPAKTAEFSFFGISNFSNFYSNYEKYISSKNQSSYYENIEKEFNKEFDINIETTILKFLDNSVCFAGINFNNSIEDLAYVSIFKSNDIENLKKILCGITEEYYLNNKIKESFYIDYHIDNNHTHTIYKLHEYDFTEIIFGEISNLPKLNYYFFYDNYIIFCESSDDAKLYIYSLFRNNTLSNDSDFIVFQKTLPQKTNILFYINSYYNLNKQIDAFNENFKNIFKSNLGFFSKIQFISLNFSFEKQNFFKTDLNLFYNKNLTNKGQTAWEIELKNNLATKPFFFTNHYTYEKEIFIQDNQNVIYLFDSKGNVIWKKQLKEKIIGDIYMIDMYNSTKYQLIFTTENMIIAIDRNGEIVENFPIQLPAKTNIGLSVVDYDNNKNYRFFVPCSDKFVYAFDKNAKKVEGWSSPVSLSAVCSKVEYFSLNSKDYIVYADKTAIHILNRKGESRITVNQNFPMPDICNVYLQKPVNNLKEFFLTSDASGKITKIFFNGNVEQKEIVPLSKSHTFTANDLNNDNLLDFIFTDEKNLLVYNSNYEKIFTHTFNNNIGYKPIVLNFSDEDVRIGIVIPEENQVYIFKSDGTVCDNFPVQGNSIFSVGVLNSGSKNFNLITGFNNYLCNYLIY